MWQCPTFNFSIYIVQYIKKSVLIIQIFWAVGPCSTDQYYSYLVLIPHRQLVNFSCRAFSPFAQLEREICL